VKIQDLIATVLKNAEPVGTYNLPDLLREVGKKYATGIATADEGEQQFYLAFIDGEAEGAIYIDEKGTLYGDKAVMMMTDREKYSFYTVAADVVDAVTMGCRIFEKSHLIKNVPSALPEVGVKSGGVGVLTISVRKNGEPQNGVRVSVRKEGKIVGSDISTADGTVSFRLMVGDYECIVQDRNQKISSKRIKFNQPGSQITIEV